MIRRTTSPAWCAALTLLLCHDIHAQQERIRQPIQEFFLGRPAYTQEKDEFQCTLSPRFRNQEGAKYWNLALELEYGITSRLEIDAELSYQRHTSITGAGTTGLGETQVGVSYALLESGDPLAVTASFEVGLPTGTERDAQGKRSFRWEPSIVLARTFGQNQFHLSLVGDFGGDEAEVEYTGSFVLPFGKLTVVLETGGKRSEEWSSWFVSPGIYYTFAEGVEVGVGVPIGVTNASEEYQVVCNITVEI